MYVCVYAVYVQYLQHKTTNSSHVCNSLSTDIFNIHTDNTCVIYVHCVLVNYLMLTPPVDNYSHAFCCIQYKIYKTRPQLALMYVCNSLSTDTTQVAKLARMTSEREVGWSTL